jgi:hypothetical protein
VGDRNLIGEKKDILFSGDNCPNTDGLIPPTWGLESGVSPHPGLRGRCAPAVRVFGNPPVANIRDANTQWRNPHASTVIKKLAGKITFDDVDGVADHDDQGCLGIGRT